MSLIVYDGKGNVAMFDRGPLSTGGQGLYVEPIATIGDITIFQYNSHATAHLVRRFIKKLVKKKGYKKKPFPLDKLAKVVAKWNATLSAGEVHKGTHRIMIHWPHACPSIIVIEKGIVVEQTMHCPAILGFFESEAHGALYCSNDIMAVMDAVKKENMGDATAEILLTRLKGFDK